MTQNTTPSPAPNQPSNLPQTSLPEKRWPVKLQLVPADKPFLKNTPLLLVVDCAALACPGAIKRNMQDKAALLVCPKLEDKQEIIEKLAKIINMAQTPSIHLVHMKIPCCSLPALVTQAQEMAGTALPVTMSRISIYGHEDLPGLGGNFAGGHK